MLLSAHPGVTPHNRKGGKRIKNLAYVWGVPKSTAAWVVCVLFLFFVSCQNLQHLVTDISDFLLTFSSLRHLCHSVPDKDWCERLCEDQTWEELHQKQTNTFGLQVLIVPACLHTCLGFTPRLVNPTLDFKRSTELCTGNFTRPFTPCQQPAVQVQRR